MNKVEVTGQPCSGKTNYIRNKASLEGYYYLNETKLDKLLNFISGFIYLGIARSGAPICSGTIQLAKPLISGMAARKIIVVPCRVKN